MRLALALGAYKQCGFRSQKQKPQIHWACQLCGLLKGLIVVREGPGDMQNVKTRGSCDTENPSVQPCSESLGEHPSYRSMISVPKCKSPSLLLEPRA